MGFLTPIAAIIAAGITVPLLVAMYFLKLRRRKVVVASTLLWRKAIQDMQVNSPFQKMRRNLLLWIQLLLLAALLLALARPTQRTTAQPGHQVVIVIDHSGSMNAKGSGGDTRLEEAKARALELVDAAADSANGTTGGAMVVSFAERAQVVQPFTNDPTLLRSAIRSIRPTDQRSNIGEALRLVEPFALRSEASEEEALTVHVFSDGRVHGGGGELSLRGAELKYKLIGSEQAQTHADNLAIVSLSARRDFEKPQRVQVFARVANYGSEQVSANLTLALDGIPTRVSPVRVPAAKAAQKAADGTITVGEPGSQSVQFDFVLTDAALVELRHDHKDLLTMDDAAWLTIAPARRLRVLLVTRGNAFLDRVIRSAKVRDLVLMTPDKYENQDPALLRRGGWDATGFGVSGGAGEGFDVIVFDDYTPKLTPLVNSLYLGGAPPIAGLELRPAREGDQPTQVIYDWARDHALMRYVVLDDVVLSQPGRIVVPVGGNILATGQHGPLMAELTAEGVHHVMTSFNILQSNWPLYVSFPVFISNSLQVLGLGALADQAGVSRSVGEPIVVRVDGGASGGEVLRYSGPVDVSAKVSMGRAILPPMTRVGVYKTEGAVEPPDDRLAVNLLDPVESDLRVASRLAVGTIDAAGESATASIRIEVWHWFAWAALAVLMVEWVVYTRRMHL